jgi:hypothetical protein
MKGGPWAQPKQNKEGAAIHVGQSRAQIMFPVQSGNLTVTRIAPTKIAEKNDRMIITFARDRLRSWCRRRWWVDLRTR